MYNTGVGALKILKDTKEEMPLWHHLGAQITMGGTSQQHDAFKKTTISEQPDI